MPFAVAKGIHPVGGASWPSDVEIFSFVVGKPGDVTC
jgi:hypothetical protein